MNTGIFAFLTTNGNCQFINGGFQFTGDIEISLNFIWVLILYICLMDVLHQHIGATELSWLDLALLIVYTLVCIGIGLWNSRKQADQPSKEADHHPVFVLTTTVIEGESDLLCLQLWNICDRGLCRYIAGVYHLYSVCQEVEAYRKRTEVLYAVRLVLS